MYFWKYMTDLDGLLGLPFRISFLLDFFRNSNILFIADPLRTFEGSFFATEVASVAISRRSKAVPILEL
jgi:hypothetical protein